MTAQAVTRTPSNLSNTLTTYDNEKHPEEKKVIIEGEDFCEDVFDAFVRKGEAVGIDEVHVKTYCPVRARQTVMRIIFYATESIDGKFVDDQDVKQLGELSIDIGRPFQSVEDKTVKVTLLFGATHIYATATNREGTEIRNCEFKFECAGSSGPATSTEWWMGKQAKDNVLFSRWWGSTAQLLGRYAYTDMTILW